MPRHADPNPPAYEFVTLSFRVIGKHAKIVHDAAQRRDLTAAAYMRELVMHAACADLGVPVPAFEAPMATSLVEIAKSQGISVKEFEQRAIREAAERAAKAAGLGPRPFTRGTYTAHESGTRPATRRTDRPPTRAKVIASSRD